MKDLIDFVFNFNHLSWVKPDENDKTKGMSLIKRLKFEWKEYKDIKLLMRVEITRKEFYKRQPHMKEPFPIIIPARSGVKINLRVNLGR